MEKIFSKQEMADIYLKGEQIGEGAFGSVKQYDYFTLIKTYNTDVKNAINSMDADKLSDALHIKRDRDLEIVERIPKYETRERKILKAKKRLSATPCYDLIKGIAIYDDYAFGTFLRYYRQYDTFNLSCLEKYSKEEREEIIHKLRIILDELHKEYIYPYDLKYGNVMVRDRDLDVKLIDLEATNVYYCDTESSKCRDISNKSFEHCKKLFLR